ncbi:MAG TPA: GAF domain-containing sensor histidine kinase, partial [Roseiflexaceae bacterium]|nr:GAF domain-containing sensor histidine kinase [Roseiflexaceae bacterium]
GLTQRRMSAVAAGTLLLALLFVLSIFSPVVPASAASLWQIMQDGVGLAAGLSFFIGFAPPAALRRAWQEPELRAFLARAVELPRLPDTAAIVAALEQGAMRSIGAQGATIGLWDPSDGKLHYSIDPTAALEPDAPSPGALAFRTQRPLFTDNVPRDFPTFAVQSRQFQATAVLVAPITAGQKRLGTLTVFASRAPIFAEDDLALVQLLADQAAVILESRALIDAEARVQVREEVARLKEEFLAAAAHDLKTPLTTILARAQLMERRVLRDPQAPADLPSIQILVRETRRLQRLVLELLDAARAEHGQLVGEQNTVDLTGLAQLVCARHTSDQHGCEVEDGEPIVGVYDDVRLEQVLDNLVSNAIKYSPQGSPVRVRLWREGQEVLLTVSDSGIGIPAADLPHVFERFYRSANADDRHFPGLGLGLYICRTIVEQHGGRIWVTSNVGQGTTFHVALPYVPAPVEEHAG